MSILTNIAGIPVNPLPIPHDLTIEDIFNSSDYFRRSVPYDDAQTVTKMLIDKAIIMNYVDLCLPSVVVTAFHRGTSQALYATLREHYPAFMADYRIPLRFSRGGEEHLKLVHLSTLWLHLANYRVFIEKNYIDVSSEKGEIVVECGDTHCKGTWNHFSRHNPCQYFIVVPFQYDDRASEFAAYVFTPAVNFETLRSRYEKGCPQALLNLWKQEGL